MFHTSIWRVEVLGDWVATGLDFGTLWQRGPRPNRAYGGQLIRLWLEGMVWWCWCTGSWQKFHKGAKRFSGAETFWKCFYACRVSCGRYFRSRVLIWCKVSSMKHSALSQVGWRQIERVRMRWVCFVAQWRAEGCGANGATAPGIQGRGASKEWNYEN